MCSLQGVLAQAKNGDKLFWEEKFHAANGFPKNVLKKPCFVCSLLSFWGVGVGGIFYYFSMVPYVLPLCSL
jgi:hypothetical protein